MISVGSVVQVHPGPPTVGKNSFAFLSSVLSPPSSEGAIAQLGERLPCTQEVIGSIPIGSTISGIRYKVLGFRKKRREVKKEWMRESIVFCPLGQKSW